MKHLSTTQFRSILAIIIVITVIVTAALFNKTCVNQDQSTDLVEYTSFDEAPWDVEFTEDYVYNVDSEYIYFYEDTLFNETTQGIMMFKVRKDLALQTLDDRDPYYMTKSCIVEFERSTIVRKDKEGTSKEGG